jgi:aminoglycoside phosphotransferase family enzyme/predicted kinase
MDDETPAPTSIETHISWVLLAGERAYKIPKPVVTDVVDQGTVERRHAGCARELELNARLAADVYLGVGTIELDGEVLDPVLVMRRMPDDRRLSRLLDGETAGPDLRAVARALAAFHGSASVLQDDQARAVASQDALARRWDADIAGLRAVGDPSMADRIDLVHRLALDYVTGRGVLLDERIHDGMIVDGHGDLLADDIFCLDDGPRILDCLAFSDELRCGDVLADVGFLVMDLHRSGHADLGRQFLRWYCEFSGEHHPGSLAHLYVAHRALVRAKVAALRSAQQGRRTAGVEASRLLDLALDHLERATVRVVLVGGLPGSGKSTVAGRFADEFGWAVLSSDEVRRDLGLRTVDIGAEAAYDPATVAAVYDRMRHRAEELVRRGTSVVLDATWSSASERDLLRNAVRGSRSRLVELRCDAPMALCRERVGRRTDPSHSEATVPVVDLLAERFDTWPEALEVDTSQRQAAPVP